MRKGPERRMDLGLGSVMSNKVPCRREVRGTSVMIPAKEQTVIVGASAKRSSIIVVESLVTVSRKSRLDGCFLPGNVPVSRSSAG